MVYVLGAEREAPTITSEQYKWAIGLLELLFPVILGGGIVLVIGAVISIGLYLRKIKK